MIHPYIRVANTAVALAQPSHRACLFLTDMSSKSENTQKLVLAQIQPGETKYEFAVHLSWEKSDAVGSGLELYAKQAPPGSFLSACKR